MAFTCSPVNDIAVSFGGSTAEKISIKVGGSIGVTLSYSCVTPGSGCEHSLNWTQVDPSGTPSAYIPGGQDPAAEDTEYTNSWTAPSTTGLWKLKGGVVWYTEDDPRAAPIVVYDSEDDFGNVIYALVWDENDKPTGTPTESEPPDDPTWTETTGETGSFTEGTPPSDGWTETSKPSGSPAENQPE